MEVHHHPQVEKKNFKEYFLEFLMIFIAVTMGFFAESLRENIVDSHKEHQYMSSMVTDLKKDTAELTQYLAWQQYDISKMDSALKIPVEKLNDIDMQDIFYHHFVYFYSWVFLFYQNDNTFTQLKNEGGFNVIRYKAITDSIGGLELLYNQQVKLNGNYYNDDYKKVEELGAHIMIMPEPPVWSEDTLYKFYPQHVEVLTRNDRPSLEELYSWIRNEKGTLRVYMSNEKIYREAAIRLIDQINNKYNLKNN